MFLPAQHGLTDDHGLLRTEQARTPICAAVANTAMTLATLVTVLGVHHDVLDLTSDFSMYSWPLSHSVILPSHGRGSKGSLKHLGCLPSPTVCLEMVAWALSLFSFPTSVKWVCGVFYIMLICKDLPLLLDTLKTVGTPMIERMGGEPTENSRPRSHHKVFESHLVGQDAHARSCYWKHTSLSNT